jgi:tetratricopeptide (TPR) repeat protein
MNRHLTRNRPVSLLVILIHAFAVSGSFLGPATAVAQTSAGEPQVERGEGYYEQSRFDEAIGLLKDLVQNNTLSGQELERAREILARSYVKKGYPVQAREMFKEILRANPDWRPDPIRVPPDEAAVFQDALKEFQSGVSVPPTPAPSSTETTPTPAPNAPPVTTSMETKSSKKSLFSRWYFYAGLALVGVGAAAAMGGGGGDDDDTQQGEPLPSYPAHP